MTARIVHPNPHGALSEDRLVRFENQFGLLLPADYRDFLLEYNGGRPVPAFFWIKHQQDGTTVHQFYGLYDQLIPSSLETHLGTSRRGIPTALMPIGDDGIGNLICIGLGWIEFGRIYFLDHDLHRPELPESWDGITRLANTFGEFLASLQEEPSC